MTERVDKPGRIGWIEPTYLNLDWDTNRFPTPNKELTRDEFDILRDHGTYSVAGLNYDNTVYLPDQPDGIRRGFGGYIVHYYFFPHYALAIADRYMRYGDYDSENYPACKGNFLPKYLPDEELSKHTYGFARRYFKIGCEHTWKELSMKESRKEGVSHYGNCYHVNKCYDCGMVWSYDSSG